MARIFISHASSHLGNAKIVEEQLLRLGHRVFLSGSPTSGIDVGDDWEQRLYERLRWADVVVFIVTPSFVESHWCTAEVGAARARGSLLLPILFDGGSTHPLLKSVQHITVNGNVDQLGHAMSDALQRLGLSGAAQGWDDSRPPFPGLRSFNVDESSIFFGREAEKRDLTSMLRSAVASGTNPIILVVGGSGSGKSSLVRAGVLPGVSREPGWWTIPVMTPTALPVAVLAERLSRTAAGIGLEWAPSTVRETLLAGRISDVVVQVLAKAPGSPRNLLLVLDQLEELFVLAADAERLSFLDVLRSAAGSPLQVVATIRPEYLHDAMDDARGIFSIPARVYALAPLQQSALRSIIEGPAEFAGMTFEPNLVERLLDDTGSSTALPLLAYTLAELSVGVKRGQSLSNARYEGLGGVRGTLRRQADLALDEAALRNEQPKDVILGELLELVTVDERRQPVRRRIRWTGPPTNSTSTLSPFIERRLLLIEDAAGTATISVAHEAFFEAWHPMRDVISRASAALAVRTEIENAAREWSDRSQPRALLWERGRLASALHDVGARPQLVWGQADGVAAVDGDDTFLGPAAAKQGYFSTFLHRRWPRRPVYYVGITGPVQLNTLSKTFLSQSVSWDLFRRWRATATLSVLLVASLVASLLAFQGQYTALERQRLAVANQLVAQADATREGDPRRSLLLSLAAQRIQQSPKTNASLVQTLTSARFSNVLVDNREPESHLAVFAPNVPLLATSNGSNLRFWDLSDPQARKPVGGGAELHDSIQAMVFSSDGSFFVAQTFSTISVWTMAEPMRPHLLARDVISADNLSSALAVSPDGRFLATGTFDATVIIWDISDMENPSRIGDALGGSQYAVSSLGFSPDGQTLVAGSFGAVLLWDVGRLPEQPVRLGEALEEQSGNVQRVRFSPDGAILATSSDDSNVILRGMQNRGQPVLIGTPIEFDDFVFDVALSPDGRMLAGVTASGQLDVWDVSVPDDPQRLEPSFVGHTARIYSVSFSPDGRSLATASNDGSVLIWDFARSAQPRWLDGSENRHSKGVFDVSFSPDSRLLASGDGSGYVRLSRIDAAGEALSAVGPGIWDADQNGFLRISPDGRALAVGTGSGVVKLWDITNPENPVRIGRDLVSGQSGNVLSLAWSADGSTLAAANDDGSFALWSVSDRAAPALLAVNRDHQVRVFSIVFSSDGKKLATAGSDFTARLWDVTNPTLPIQLGQPIQHTGEVGGVCFSPDGRVLATVSDDSGTILWNVENPEAPVQIGAPLADASFAVVFSPDGQLLHSSTDRLDAASLLWDVSDITQVRPFGLPLEDPPVNPLVYTVAFAPNGRFVATGSIDGVVRVADLGPLIESREQATQRACALLGGGMNRELWASYVPGIDYLDSCAT